MKNLNKFFRSQKISPVRYSVITAVFNTEQYLNDFFISIVQQKCFQGFIEIICVDDGSTDDSAKIIKEWQARYPRNIQYYYQENAGPGAARNMGLRVATGDWITFIDSDDFIAEDYFSIVGEEIASGKENKLIICNHYTYDEKTKRKILEHPLKFRFTHNKEQVTLSDRTKFVHILVNSAFFRRDSIFAANLSFDPDLRPTFEDGDFVLKYLLSIRKPKVLLLRTARYFHRIRISEDSLYSSAKNIESHYILPFTSGLRIVQNTFVKRGFIPQFLQQTLLYMVTRYYKSIIRNQIHLDAISPGLRERFSSLINNIFTYIDADSIRNPYFPFLSEDLEFYFLTQFKPKERIPQKIYIIKYDSSKQQLLIHYFSANPSPEIFFSVNNTQVTPVYSKLMEKKFSGSPAYYKYCVWIQIPTVAHCIAAHSDANQYKFIFMVKNKKFMDIASVDTIIRILSEEPCFSIIDKEFYCKKIGKTTYFKNKYANSWVFMDRDVQADDNAEHMYRFVAKKYPHVKIFFILRKNSHDWDRLYKEGFNLIPFGGISHLAALMNCDYFLSSHLDKYVTSYYGKKLQRCMHYKFVYFGHGVFKDDLSDYLAKRSPLVDCFTRTTEQEYHSIVDDHSPYTLSEKEVVLTGMPRHDSLFDLSIPQENLIVFMPTWRNKIVGSVNRSTNTRAKVDSFLDSEYARKIYSLLASERLDTVLRTTGYKFVFFPHVNIQPYLPDMKIPTSITCLRHSDIHSIQTLFKRAKILITDYSSVAFEAALIGRHIIYYQFDRVTIFGSGHFYKKGYYSYEEHGFGPVIETESALLDYLMNCIGHDCRIDDVYLQRMRDTFQFRDTNNRERVFQAIQNLRRPVSGSMWE